MGGAFNECVNRVVAGASAAAGAVWGCIGGIEFVYCRTQYMSVCAELGYDEMRGVFVPVWHAC